MPTASPHSDHAHGKAHHDQSGNAGPPRKRRCLRCHSVSTRRCSSLGLDKHLADLANIRADDIGLSLDENRLPQKIYLPRRNQN